MHADTHVHTHTQACTHTYTHTYASMHTHIHVRALLLTLCSDVSYSGRPVVHRMSLVEMAVPYADPRVSGSTQKIA